MVESEEAGAKVEVKEPKKVPSDSVQNPADPDASYNARRGQCYAAQVMEPYGEDDEEDVPSGPDLITHVAVHKMTVHHAQRLAPALKISRAAAWFLVYCWGIHTMDRSIT